MSSSESDDDHILSRLFGVRRGQTRPSRKGHGGGSRLFSYLQVPKKLQRWGDSDSDDDYSSSPPSPSHAQAASIALPPSPPGSQPSSPKNHTPPPPPPPPPLKHETNPFQAEPVVESSDAPEAPPMKPKSKKVDYEAKYAEPETPPDAPPMAPPMAPPNAPPNAPPMDPPMEQAVAKVTKKAMSASLLDDIRQGGKAKQAAKASLAKTVNAAVNVMIGNGFLSTGEGKDLKNALFSSAVKAIQKTKATEAAPSADAIFAAIRSGAARLKPASARTQAPPPPPTGAEAKAKEAVNRLSSRRQALQPDDEWDE